MSLALESGFLFEDNKTPHDHKSPKVAPPYSSARSLAASHSRVKDTDQRALKTEGTKAASKPGDQAPDFCGTLTFWQWS